MVFSQIFWQNKISRKGCAYIRLLVTLSNLDSGQPSNIPSVQKVWFNSHSILII